MSRADIRKPHPGTPFRYAVMPQAYPLLDKERVTRNEAGEVFLYERVES